MATTSISEFERTKPTETMKALNALIRKVNDFLIARYSNEKGCDTQKVYALLDETVEDLRVIKQKLKNGE